MDLPAKIIHYTLCKACHPPPEFTLCECIGAEDDRLWTIVTQSPCGMKLNGEGFKYGFRW